MPIQCPRHSGFLRAAALLCAAVFLLLSGRAAGTGLWQLKAGLASADPLKRAEAALEAGRGNRGELAPELAGLSAKDPETPVRIAALKALASFNPPPPDVTPALILALADRESSVREAATVLRPAMKTRVPQELPNLVPLLVHANPDVRATAALAISDFPDDAGKYLSRIEKLSEDPVPSVREAARAAAEAIRHPAIRNYTGGSAQEWLERIKDPDPAVRLKAIKGLAATGDTAGDTAAGNIVTVEALLGCFSDTDEKIRYRAAWALLDLAPRIPQLRDAVRRRLGDPSPEVRKMARYTMDWMPSEAGAKP